MVYYHIEKTVAIVIFIIGNNISTDRYTQNLA